MRWICTHTLLASLLLICSAEASAQRVSGTVRTNDTGAPVAGAIISAYRGRDTSAAVLARSDGRFQITLTGARDVTLFVRAIGMQPVRIPIRGNADTVVDVSMSRISHTLQRVSVTGMTECLRRQTGTANVVDIWVEVTNALESTRIARDSVRRRFDYNLYEILTDLKTGKGRILKNDSSSWVSTRPFKVTPPRDLADEGYVVEEARTARNRLDPPSTSYRAPDEMVLLDRSFQTSHCFWAAHGSGENDGFIGVYFLPRSGIKINDIRGVFWLDAKTYELKRLDYIYTQVVVDPPRGMVIDSMVTPTLDVAPALENPEPGGVIEFMRLDDGSFIIPAWRIYLNDTWTRETIRGVPIPKPNLGKETGGLVLRMRGTG